MYNGHFFGVVILYNPNADVKKNIASYLPYIDRLFVIDNSEPASSILIDLKFEAKIVVIADGQNNGISYRLNQVAELAIKENAQWLLTMDQDSSFPENMMRTYLSCVRAFPDKNKVAMFGVDYEAKELPNVGCSYNETDNLITSGSIVNLKLFQTLKGFDENLFIDEVDSEYCSRAKLNDYRIVRFNTILLNHSLGTVLEYRSLKNFKKTPRTLHAPVRIYYMVRNYLYVERLYKQKMPHSFPARKATILNRIKNNLLYGNERLKIIKYIFQAYIDYKKGRMGKKK